MGGGEGRGLGGGEALSASWVITPAFRKDRLTPVSPAAYKPGVNCFSHQTEESLSLWEARDVGT